MARSVRSQHTYPYDTLPELSTSYSPNANLCLHIGQPWLAPLDVRCLPRTSRTDASPRLLQHDTTHGHEPQALGSTTPTMDLSRGPIERLAGASTKSITPSRIDGAQGVVRHDCPQTHISPDTVVASSVRTSRRIQLAAFRVRQGSPPESLREKETRLDKPGAFTRRMSRCRNEQ